MCKSIAKLATISLLQTNVTRRIKMLIQVPEHFLENKNILKLSTLSFLYYFNREKTQKVNIQINKHMLIHVFNGSKTIHTNDKHYTIDNKQSAFISQGQYFMSELLCTEKSYFDGIMVFFDDDFLLSMFSKYPSLSNKSHHRSKSTLCIVAKSKALHETMLSTKAYLQRNSDESLLIQLKFEEIFLQLLQSDNSNEILHYFQSLYSNSLFKFKNLFENNHFDSVKEMIKQSNLSEIQFRKLFYELYASTPKEWLLKKALLKSKLLLEDKRLSITEVSHQSGFNSLSWFTKSFKEAFGITPKKYQQNC
jgi:AraC-like DNA-binding protein